MGELAGGSRRQHRAARRLVQPPDGGFRGRRVGARARMPADQRAGLAGVEQDDGPLGLDAVGEPVLQAVLADGALASAPGAALVVLRDEIEAAVLGRAVRRQRTG